MNQRDEDLARLTGVGTVLAGKYRVEKLVGSGGMGAVVAARHLRLGTRVAIKFLLPRPNSRVTLADRFLREARAVSRITNPHVSRVFDVDLRDDGVPYIVMEFLEGETLGSTLRRRGRLDVGESVDLLLGAAEAIAQAHALGIVHRDLKPENLFVTQTADGAPPILKVLDFGISKTPHTGDTEPSPDSTTGDGFMGSPPYMSPEQLTTPGDVDARGDVWSLGVVLYECVTGTLPFRGSSIGQTCVQILQHAPPAVSLSSPGVPAEFDAVVQRCLAKSRDERFSTLLELSRELAPFGTERARASLRAIAALSNPVPISEPSAKDQPSSPTIAPSTLTLPSLDTAPAPTAGSVRQTGPVRGRLWLAGAAALLAASTIALALARPRARGAPVVNVTATQVQSLASVTPAAPSSVPSQPATVELGPQVADRASVTPPAVQPPRSPGKPRRAPGDARSLVAAHSDSNGTRDEGTAPSVEMPAPSEMPATDPPPAPATPPDDSDESFFVDRK